MLIHCRKGVALVLLWTACLHIACGDAPDSGRIHLNIDYPRDDKDGSLHVNTGKNVDPAELKTPVVIIASKPMVDYERLYKKMMEESPRKKENIEKDVVYNKNASKADPASRREMLFELLKEAEATLAFYRADYSEMQLLLSSQGK